ncbi:hypothetical protein TIFTF001_031040 [Ficus carica]|uniref:Uncharacterized protein n=1 Tax=Ficus carica TaxID=3494 RepID=A0AA88J4M4_FICCA|nr:hypothetical protein TIFTF001_031040 [Ficus carica]
MPDSALVLSPLSDSSVYDGHRLFSAIRSPPLRPTAIAINASTKLLQLRVFRRFACPWRDLGPSSSSPCRFDRTCF